MSKIKAKISETKFLSFFKTAHHYREAHSYREAAVLESILSRKDHNPLMSKNLLCNFYPGVVRPMAPVQFNTPPPNMVGNQANPNQTMLHSPGQFNVQPPRMMAGDPRHSWKRDSFQHIALKETIEVYYS